VRALSRHKNTLPHLSLLPAAAKKLATMIIVLMITPALKYLRRAILILTARLFRARWARSTNSAHARLSR
jgi:hypothetical protein